MDELLKKLGEVDSKIDALLAHDDLTDEQRAEHEKLVAERGKLVAKIAAEEDRAERAAERAEIEARQKLAADKAAEIAKRQAAAGAGRLTDTDKPAVPGVHTETSAAGTKFAIPAGVRRTGSLKIFRGDRHGYSAEERAYRFGMFGLALLSIQIPGRFRNRKAEAFWEKEWAAATTSNDASGTQYLIPEEFSSDIIDLREQYGVARRMLRVVPMASDTKKVPRRQGGLTAYFPGEGGAGTESNKVWDQVELVAKKPMVLSRLSNEVNADAAINFGDDLAGEISYAFAHLEDQMAFIGDGTSTYGRVIGASTKLQDVDGAGTDSFGLATGSGNAYSELVLGDFHSVVGKLPQFADTDNAAWVCHRTFFYTVMQKLELASGGVTAMEVSQGDRRPRPLFLGYPVNFSQVMPSAEANSQVCAMLGDFAMGAILGDRGGEEIAFSQEASINGQSLWERDEIGIRGTERIDINVHDVGTSSVAGPIVGLQTAAS